VQRSVSVATRSADDLGDDSPPLKWSDLRYVRDIKEDCNGKEAIRRLRRRAASKTPSDGIDSGQQVVLKGTQIVEEGGIRRA